ncbi:phosphoribosylformylglycinamidine synthase subunit PurL [Helicobacter sp. MIT 00-7814]|uniref:phosphoribosylformylglycinamidine synthase subunit PurL n=1 Tax=unclassified Helicobacter TaxID=2593540 RepID=UPI000E1E4488|nr:MULTISPECIES: phosphoribosylformylglycinamidine synthase subunit PurL [unclassified Helicobacter]RDU54594.1 phosphoribosylformylglycinamidine synthase subunit PurL [Helicobacter sp. MIT 00-7814]RDU54653.1 phosphoribosylformylglycinamidine synthase subunit PurL [Helicobacter sp. MIT 99-10781]
MLKTLTTPLGENKDLQAVLDSHKLDAKDYARIVTMLHRAPNLIELGVISAMWSEHCSYKSSKKYLNGFPTSAPWVVQGPGENAGVIDIDGKNVAVFKIESHNHPSFIEPHAGAATGVGGIMRDIFTMGARPVASLNSIRFGDVADSGKVGKKHRYLLRGVVEGIGGYGNCMGVPTIGGEMSFETCYNGNILVNAFCLGLAKKEEIFYAKAEGVGNPVIYVGSKTGRDGLGGAVMSSDSFSSDSKGLKSAVQVGDPFAEKLLLEACLELFKKDYIVGIQDMGAAGLTSSSFEMAGKSGAGMRLDLDKVPMRESGMNPYELMLSESQERMLICAKKGYEAKVLEIFAKWEVDCAVIGEVTNSGLMELYWYDEPCARLPIAELSSNAPMLDRATKETKRESAPAKTLKTTLSAQEMFEKLLGSLEISDKKWVYSQYDSSVQTNTIVGPGQGDASVIRIKESEAGIAMSVYCDVRASYLNPKEGAKLSVAHVGRDCATRGARMKAISDCLNFGSPNNAEVMWEFKESCEGIKEACKILNTPVVSGNVSLHNQSDGKDIYPTPSIVGVGVIENSAKTIGSALQSVGSALVLFGEIEANFSASLAQKLSEGKIYGEVPRIDLAKEARLWDFLCENIESNKILSAKNVGQGGLAVALAKMALLGNKGIKVESALADSYMLFAQTPGCVVVEVDSKNMVDLIESARAQGLQARQIGAVEGEGICIDSLQLDFARARELYFESFEEVLERDL